MITVTMLVVDDEPDIVDLFRRRFRREIRRGEYVMHFADSGETALQLLHANTDPEVMLILSDINMPGISGYDLLRHARANWPHVPIAMITAYGDDASRRRALDAGAADFVTKPIDFVRLRDTVERLVPHAG